MYEEAELNIGLKYVKKIKFNNIEIINDAISIGIEELDQENFVQSYAIDPTGLNFTDAVVTVIAKGTELYKCKDWNFAEQECYGEWGLFKTDLIPGEEYSFILTPDDPGFGEILVTGAVHLDFDYNFISDIYDEVKEKDDIWSEEINSGEYVRVKFEENLTNENVIDVFVKGNGSFEIYNVNTTSPLLGSSDIIESADGEWNYITLSEIDEFADVFDFKINGILEFDYIHDQVIATYNSTFGAPYCLTSESPCVANSDLLKCKANCGANTEPNEPNTVDDCIDGALAVIHFTDESIENITIISSGDSFIGGTNVTVNVTVHCYSGSDELSIAYANSTDSPQWRVIVFDDTLCSVRGIEVLSKEFTLDNIEGNHVIRGIIDPTFTASETCGDHGYADNDDVVFVVDVEPLPTPEINITGVVFDDLDNNSVFDGSDSGIGGVTLRLWNDTNSNDVLDVGVDVAMSSTMTNSSGNYSILNLYEGNYIIDVVDWHLRLVDFNRTTSRILSFNVSNSSLDFGFTDLDRIGNGTVSSDVKISDGLAGFAPIGLETGEMFGDGIANIGDLDGDGVVDLAVGAPQDETVGNLEGALYILFMNSNGSVKDNIKIGDGSEGFYPDGLGASDWFGVSVANLGDLDGDGVVDLAVGAYSDEADTDYGEGAIYILFMNSNGSVKDNIKIGDGMNGFTPDGLNGSDRFGSAIANLGDLDGDGVVDLAVGAEWDEKTSGTNKEGAVYILFLNSNGSVKDDIKIADGMNGFTPEGLVAAKWFGFAVTNIGDLDNDGVVDLAVGAPLDENDHTSEGAIYILFMNINGSVKEDVKIADNLSGFIHEGVQVGDWFGTSITNLGDLDNDGVVDLAVGAFWDEGPSGNGEGAVHILFMNSNGSVKDNFKISDGLGGFTPNELDNDDRFGNSIANLGDLDGNGIVDLAVGAFYDEANSSGETTEGAVYILFLDSFDSPADNPPQITQVQPIGDITLSQFTTKTVDVLFNVTDQNGYTDLNDSLAWCRLSKTGEVNRTSSSCIAQDQSGNDLVYNCSIGMYYYDSSGIWNIICYAEDVGGLNDTNNTETATVNPLNYVVQDLTALNWTDLAPANNDEEAQSPLILTNGGNQEYTDFNITSQNATYSSNIIPNNKFMIDNETGLSSGQTYLNDSGVDWSEGNLARCTSPCSSNSTEVAYFYVDTPTGILSGVYNSIANWSIEIS
jgi:hypothetical protein